MGVATIEQQYERYSKPLPPAERLRLLELTVHDLAHSPSESQARPERSLMVLRGLNAGIRKGIDAQEYVDILCSEWDHRP